MVNIDNFEIALQISKIVIKLHDLYGLPWLEAIDMVKERILEKGKKDEGY